MIPDMDTRMRGLLASWLDAAKVKLAQPDKIGAKELNRLGELLLSVAALHSEHEAKVAAKARAEAAKRVIG